MRERVGSLQGERVSAWEWTQTTLLGANLVWTTLCLGGYRPETMVVTLALTGLLLAVHCAARAVDNRAVDVTDWTGWFIIPFLVYALINVVWVTPVPWLGWLDWLGWANLSAVFWVTLNGIRSSRTRRILFFTFIGLGIAAVLLGCYQRFVRPGWLMLGRNQVEQFLDRASGPFGIPNSLAGFLILLLPATGALTFRRQAGATERVWWAWVSLVFGLGVLLTVSRGGWIALALALVAWPLIARRWSWKRRLISALVMVGIMVGSAAVLFQAAPNIRNRFERLVRDSGELSRPILWRAAWENFRTRPVTGSGAGSYNIVFEQFRPERFVDEPQWAHNEYLNTLSDYGGIGLILLLGAAGAIAIGKRRDGARHADAKLDWLDSTLVREGLAIGLLAFAIQAFVDFHFKIPALAMTFAVVAALALGRRTPAPLDSSTARPRAVGVGWLLASGAVAIAMVPVLRFYRAEALRYGSRQALDEFASNRNRQTPDLLERAERDLIHATSLAPSHASAWADLAHALALRAFTDPNRVAEWAGPAVKAANRATELGGEVSEFWIRLGVALDMQARAVDAQTAFEKSVRLAPRNGHAWYYYAHHLSLDTKRRDEALRAIANCLSLDPGNRAAEALRVKLNERSSGALFIP